MRQSVAWARDEPEELRNAVDKVEDLGNQEEDQRLGEVAEDADDNEDHASEITVGISHENSCRVPVVEEQGKAHAEERQEEEE